MKVNIIGQMTTLEKQEILSYYERRGYTLGIASTARKFNLPKHVIKYLLISHNLHVPKSYKKRNKRARILRKD